MRSTAARGSAIEQSTVVVSMQDYRMCITCYMTYAAVQTLRERVCGNASNAQLTAASAQAVGTGILLSGTSSSCTSFFGTPLQSCHDPCLCFNVLWAISLRFGSACPRQVCAAFACGWFKQGFSVLLLQAVQTELIKQALLGLQHCHTKFVLHRDVKPANILIALSRCSAWLSTWTA